jgi:hypothetical protein
MAGMAKARIAKTPGDAKMNSELKLKQQAEAAFQKMLNTTKVTNIQKARKQIYDKYGVWPNGATN